MYSNSRVFDCMDGVNRSLLLLSHGNFEVTAPHVVPIGTTGRLSDIYFSDQCTVKKNYIIPN